MVTRKIPRNQEHNLARVNTETLTRMLNIIRALLVYRMNAGRVTTTNRASTSTSVSSHPERDFYYL